MEIKKLTLHAQNFEEQFEFYIGSLGFDPTVLEFDSFTVQAGETELTFKKSDADKQLYHFAFLIPTGNLEEAISFLKALEIPVVPYKDSEIVHFEKGRAIYFYDADGNILEFIERPSLGIEKVASFGLDQIQKINEISLPSTSPSSYTQKMVAEHRIKMLSPGEYGERFNWLGDFNGAFLVVLQGRPWLPLDEPALANKYEIEFEESGETYNLSF